MELHGCKIHPLHFDNNFTANNNLLRPSSEWTENCKVYQRMLSVLFHLHNSGLAGADTLTLTKVVHSNVLQNQNCLSNAINLKNYFSFGSLLSFF